MTSDCVTWDDDDDFLEIVKLILRERVLPPTPKWKTYFF